MDEDRKEIGKRVRQARVARGLTQEELARQSGMAARTIRSIEYGRTLPRRLMAGRLAAALGVAIEWLMQGDVIF